MSDQLLIHTDNRGVCTLTLNRPERHNALNAELIVELVNALTNVNNDPNIRVLVITGNGDSFSSGADMEWMKASANYDEETNRQDAMLFTQLMRTLYDLQKPTIALINGPSYGGGLGVIACCDIAIASTTAKFAFTEVRLGLVPAVISPYVIVKIGPSHARRLFLTAEQFSATQALAFDLVHFVVDKTELNTLVDQQIQHLLKAGPLAARASKLLTPRLATEEVENELTALIAALRASPEGQEGLAAFLEKRKPSWIKG
ncbi:enoyl-CoA hydratase-related protein [Pseudomonadota bacterium]